MLEYIKKNPYRILGVYANDPEKKWVENSLELFVSLKHDNTFSFPTDWPEVLGPLHRNLKDVKDAAFLLEDMERRKLESLFWVHNKCANSFIGNLGLDIDLEIAGKSYEKAINAALRAISKGNNLKALHFYKVAFHCIRPSSRVLVLFFNRVIKTYLRENPLGNVFSFLYSIFGEDFRLEFQESLQSCIPVEVNKTSVKNEDCSSTSSPRNNQQTRTDTKFQSKPKKRTSLDWKKFDEKVIRPWKQFNGWTFMSIVLLIIIIYFLFQIL